MTYTEIFDLIDLNLASGNKIPAVKHREVEHALLDYIQQNIAQSGDIKRVKCDVDYLNANFNVDGLGKNLRLGWAICNGNNGTDNLAGRVGVGYGLGYSALGGLGGSKDAIVVSHSHSMTYGSSGVNTAVQVSRDADGNTIIGTTNTNETGVSGVDKNMQPYIINLYIMKL
jgi:hypothetical protein